MTESRNISLVAAAIYLQLMEKIDGLNSLHGHKSLSEAILCEVCDKIAKLDEQAKNIEIANAKQWASIALQAQRLNQALIEFRERMCTGAERSEILNRIARGLGRIQPGEDLKYMLTEYRLEIVPEMKSINAVLGLFEEAGKVDL